MLTHVYADTAQYSAKWKHTLEANLLKVEASVIEAHGVAFESTRGGRHHGCSLGSRIYSMVLDTGATEMLCWDDQDCFLEGRRPANANILGAQEGSSFRATSRGNLLMACFLSKPQESQAGYLIRTLKHVVAKHGPWAEGPTLDQQMSAAKIQDLCGWMPRHIDYQVADF